MMIYNDKFEISYLTKVDIKIVLPNISKHLEFGHNLNYKIR